MSDQQPRDGRFPPSPQITDRPYRPGPTRASRAAAVILMVPAGLALLLTLLIPVEGSLLDVRRPGLLIPWFLLPMLSLGTALTLLITGGGRLGMCALLLVGVLSLAGWWAVLQVW